MKICIIAPKSYPLFNPKIHSIFGGAEVQLFLIGKEFTKDKSLDINFMVADYGQTDLEKYNGIKVWNSFNFQRITLIQILSFFRVFTKINAEFYFQETLTYFSGFISLFCKLTGKKFIYMLANDGEADGSHPIYRSTIKRFLANLVFRYSHLIICQNSYQKQNLENRGIKSVKIKAGYNIDERKVKKKDFVLWVGRSDPIKRPMFVLDLAKSNPLHNFVMICPPGTHHKELFVKVKDESKRIINLKFLDFVPFHKIDKYFQDAKVLINTSKQEGFPITFIQATKNKSPIISLKVNPDNALTEFKFGFSCNDKLKLMDEKLKLLLSDEHLYEKMSRNAFEYATKNHNIKKITNQLLEKMNTLI